MSRTGITHSTGKHLLQTPVRPCPARAAQVNFLLSTGVIISDDLIHAVLLVLAVIGTGGMLWIYKRLT